jgi:hypothetical protein
MNRDERDVLEVLKFELEFLEKGGYGRSPRQPWRCQLIFEDSPTCMNYDSKHNPGPCSDCVLMQFVPPEFRGNKTPCRHIPMNAEGETLDSLYRYADQNEIDDTYGKWLRTTIERIEGERHALHDSGRMASAPGGSGERGEQFFQKLHPKCANPSCVTAFHWTRGGKFFRFRAGSANSPSEHGEGDPQLEGHEVKHYWLCEHCSHVFTLVYDENQGVVLRVHWPELMELMPPNRSHAQVREPISIGRPRSGASSHIDA